MKLTLSDLQNSPQMERELLEKLDLTKLGELWEADGQDTSEPSETIMGREYFVTIAAVKNSSEGNFVAHLFALNPTKRGKHKGWPRYFWNHYRAKQEVEAWMVFNGQVAIPDQNKTAHHE